MILEALVAGGGTFSAVALAVWGATRPARRTRTECERLHHVAAMEREVYGQVMSSDAAEHVARCGKPIRPIPPSKVARAKVDIYRDGALAARAGEAFIVREEDVRHLRELVAECEAIKRAIQDVEDLRTEKPSPLIVAGIDPRAIREQERLAELRAVLESKRQAITAMTRAWESDPLNGPGATRTC